MFLGRYGYPKESEVRDLRIILQYFYPKRLATKLAGYIARSEGGRVTTRLIHWFITKYGVDLDEAVASNPEQYSTFNDFFTRPLKEGLRTVDDAEFVSPVDGAISQLGSIDDLQVVQAKGHQYTVQNLLGNDSSLAELFRHGSFINLYLSPRDYHRVHMPCDGTLREMRYVPGALFSVNPMTARGIPNLFARNERVLCIFDSPKHGSFAMILVGATVVGSMATVWHGVVNPRRVRAISRWSYDEQNIQLKKGEEMGRFLVGSTVILLFPPASVKFDHGLRSEQAIRLGDQLGNRPE